MQAIQPGLNTLSLPYVSKLMERGFLEKREKPTGLESSQFSLGNQAAPGDLQNMCSNITSHEPFWLLWIEATVVAFKKSSSVGI